MLDAPAVRHELHRQPVEQVAIEGLPPSKSEIVGRGDQAVPMRNCQSRFTMTRAVSGLSGEASQFASAARRPVAAAGSDRRRARSLSGNPGSTGSRSVVIIPDFQNISGRRILLRVVDGQRGGQRTGFSSSSWCIWRRSRPPLAVFGDECVHHFIPDEVDLRLGFFGERLLLGCALLLRHIQHSGVRRRACARSLRLSRSRYGFSISAILIGDGLQPRFVFLLALLVPALFSASSRCRYL